MSSETVFLCCICPGPLASLLSWSWKMHLSQKWHMEFWSSEWSGALPQTGEQTYWERITISGRPYILYRLGFQWGLARTTSSYHSSENNRTTVNHKNIQYKIHLTFYSSPTLSSLSDPDWCREMLCWRSIEWRWTPQRRSTPPCVVVIKSPWWCNEEDSSFNCKWLLNTQSEKAATPHLTFCSHAKQINNVQYMSITVKPVKSP